MTHADELTRPERATEIFQAKRRKALYAADRRRFCEVDKKLPQFAFDATTMGKY